MDILSLSIRGIDLYHIINWFYIYSFFGWLWETCYVSLKEKRYVNRGFVSGPVCTIYGCGALAVYLILCPLQEHTMILFLGGIIVATLLEYFTAALMESIFHTSWWDYSNQPLNLKGRICLGASLGWGCFTVILFRVLHPMVEDIVALYPIWVGKLLCLAATVVYGIDFGFAAAAAFKLRDKLDKLEEELEEKRAELLLKVNQRMTAFEETHQTNLRSIRERIEEIEWLRELEEKRAELTRQASEELKEFRKRRGKLLGRNTQRFLNSYPNLHLGYKRRHKRDAVKSAERETIE